MALYYLTKLLFWEGILGVALFDNKILGLGVVKVTQIWLANPEVFKKKSK